MIKKIKQFLLITMASSSMLTFGALSFATTIASANNITDQVCNGTTDATGTNKAVNSGTDKNGNPTCGNAGGDSSLKTLAQKIVNIFSLIVGITAVVMIIYGGFRYITSGGDSGKVGNAKSSLIYAIIGLVIVALAQFIVHYVLNTANSVGGGNTA